MIQRAETATAKNSPRIDVKTKKGKKKRRTNPSFLPENYTLDKTATDDNKSKGGSVINKGTLRLYHPGAVD